jgi:hypothetical protein
MIARRAPAPATAAPGNLLDTIKVRYGPVDLIGRFLLQGEEEALLRGISLSFATFEELLEVNESNRDSWRPLVAVFDPRLGMLDPSSSYCILGQNGRGEIVSAQAARLYDWPSTDFHEEATTLRFVYKVPQQDKRPGESISITTDAARRLTGRVVFSGAGWYRRDYRGTGLSTVLPRVSRALSLTLWDPDYIMTMMAEPVLRGGFAERGGFVHSAAMVQWRNSRLGDIDLVLVWMTAEEALSDLAAASKSLVAGDDRQIRGGGRQQ